MTQNPIYTGNHESLTPWNDPIPYIYW
jgi:hypothetical protein